MCNGRSCHSTASGPYDMMPASQPNDACTCTSGALSSASGQRWTPRMVADVEVVVVHLLLVDVADLAVVAVPVLTCNIFQ